MICSIEKAKEIFEDSFEINIKPNPFHSFAALRNFISDDLCIVFYQSDESYIKMICSRQAKELGFPDFPGGHRCRYLGTGLSTLMGHSGRYIQVTCFFSLHEQRNFIKNVQRFFGDKLIRISYFDEVEMGCLYFKNTSFEFVYEQLPLLI